MFCYIYKISPNPSFSKRGIKILSFCKREQGGILWTKIKVKGGRFLIGVSSLDNKREEIKIIRDALSFWYKKHAGKVLLNRVKLYSKKLRVSIPEVILANQTKRWGSCNRKGAEFISIGISLWLRCHLLIMIVAHELCHLKYNNHSENFWKFLGSIMPDYESRRECLRKEGVKYYL